jgi:hypothetical protein
MTHPKVTTTTIAHNIPPPQTAIDCHSQLNPIHGGSQPPHTLTKK